MSVRNHYDALGLSKNATQEEIKAAFRKLSMSTHPDVAKGADGEAFKRIASAHSVLSNPKERRIYDLQLQQKSMWRPPGNDFYGGDNFQRPGGRRKPPQHVFIETLTHPRYIVLGVFAFGSVFVMSALMGGVSSKKPEYYHHSGVVEAWKNPKTGQWEQPAPWDPLYRQLQPKLELIPRERVRRRPMK